MKSRAFLVLISTLLAGCSLTPASSSSTPASSSSASSDIFSSQETSSEATSETTSVTTSSEQSTEESVPVFTEESSESESLSSESASQQTSAEESSSEFSSSEQTSEEESSPEPSSAEHSGEEESSSAQPSSEETSTQTSSTESSEESTESESQESSASSEESSRHTSSAGPIDEWNLVTSISDLKEGDVVVLANAENEVVAGSYSSSSSSLEAVDAAFSSDRSSILNLSEEATVFTVGKSGSYWTFEAEEGFLYSNYNKKPYLSWKDGDSKWSITISKGDANIANATSNYGILEYNPSSPRFKTYKSTTSGMKPVNIYKGATSTPIWPTAIQISGPTEVGVNKSATLSLAFEPSNTNRKIVTWSSEDSGIATVDNGVVRGVSEGQTRIVVEAETENGAAISAHYDITVTQTALDAYTVMIYMCGSDLESYDSDYRQYGAQASENLAEIMKVNLPEGVNILVETGGANNWDPSYAKTLGASIPAELTRWTVQNKRLVKEADSLQPADGNMGESSTLQSFMEWGLENYPAQKTGVILWNHGGALSGCCCDERYENDALTSAETTAAFKAAFASASVEKLEWIGYDCCLMSVQDIADYNSDYFNYMIASQETEPGGGWDYDEWVADLAANPSIDTLALGQSICDSYYTKCKDTYYSYYLYDKTEYAEYKDFNDATLSVLDLSKMDAYREAFEAMATGLASVITSSSKWNSFASIVNGAERYGWYYEDWAQSFNDGYLYDVFNLSTFLTSLKSKSAYSSVDVQAVIDALGELIIYNKNGKDSPNACGLSFFCAISGYNTKSIYSTTQTNFTAWRSLNIKYGTFYSGY